MERQNGRRLVDYPLVPGSFVFELIFSTARLLLKTRLLKPNTRMHYVLRDDWALLLTPLAGSSSIRVHIEDLRVHELLQRHPPAAFQHADIKTIYVLSRDYEARLRSFYNKKVRNPTSLSKARLLATCAPLTWRSTPEEFMEWAVEKIEECDKDKHVYTLEQVSLGFGLRPEEVVYLDISRDAQRIEQLLGIKIGEQINSTRSVSTFAPPLPLPPLTKQ